MRSEGLLACEGGGEGGGKGSRQGALNRTSLKNHKVSTTPNEQPKPKVRTKTRTDPAQCEGHPSPHQPQLALAEGPVRATFR